MAKNIKAVELTPSENSGEAPLTIAKPEEEFNLDKFKSKRGAAIANIETLPSALTGTQPCSGQGFCEAPP